MTHTYPDAVALTGMIRESHDPTLIAEAYATRSHVLMGYSDWRDYASEQLRPSEPLDVEHRRAIVKAMRDVRASTRDIAPVCGTVPSVVSRDLQALGIGDGSRRGVADAQVRTLAAEGLTAKQISERLGIGPSWVASIARRNGIVLGGLANAGQLNEAARIEVIRQAAAQGASSPQIAADLGIDESRVRRIARRAGITIQADTYVGKRRKLDHTRVVRSAVEDTYGVGHLLDQIDWSQVDLTDAAAWTAQLSTAIRQLTALRQRITKEAANRGNAERPTVADQP